MSDDLIRYVREASASLPLTRADDAMIDAMIARILATPEGVEAAKQTARNAGYHVPGDPE